MRRITGVAAGDLITCEVEHGFQAGDKVVLRRTAGGAGVTVQALGALSPPTARFVIASGLTGRAFKVSDTLGGSSINYSTNITDGQVRRVNGMGR